MYMLLVNGICIIPYELYIVILFTLSTYNHLPTHPPTPPPPGPPTPRPPPPGGGLSQNEGQYWNSLFQYCPYSPTTVNYK